MGIGGTATGGTMVCAPWLMAMAIVWSAAAPAGADFYQFTFGGVVDVVDGIVPEPWDGVHVGSEFEFSYIFDSEAEDHSGVPWYGVYAIESGQLTIEGASQATLDGEIRVLNLAVDDYVVYLWDLPIGASSGVHLTGSDALESDDLPLDLDLDDWEIGMGFEVIGIGFAIGGHVADFSSQVVPGPGAMGLLAYTIFGGRRRRECSVRHI